MSTTWKTYRETGKIAADEDLRKLGLLVVDDESSIVESLKEVFHSVFDIYGASSAQQGLELFKTHGPKIVLSDQRMPEMSGLDLFTRIKEIDPDTVRILITGYSDINVVIKALNDGLVAKYLTKPWSHDELRKTVVQAARQYVREHGMTEQEAVFRGFLGA
jgi:YesN/AraC family two-component response regulator